MSTLAFRLRSTFIDVDEGAALGNADVGHGRRPRAASMPPAAKPPQEGSDIFEEEATYIAGLSGKLEFLWSSATTPGGVEARSFFEMASLPSSSPAISSPAIEKQLPMTPLALKEQEINQATSVLLLRAKMEEQLTAAADLTTRSPSSGASTEGVESSQSQDAAQEALNDGSFGHPEVCARPCLYFATGGCVHGRACSFCHLPHMKRPVHLDKKHREMLQNTPGKKLIALLVPMLKDKLLAFDSSDESLKAFERFSIACGFDSTAAAAKSLPRAPRTDRSLLVSFRAMSFRLLLLTLLRNALKDDTVAQAEGSALLTQLIRSSTSAAGATPTNLLAVGGTGLAE